MVLRVGGEDYQLGKEQTTTRDDDYFFRLFVELQCFSLGMQAEPDDVWLFRQSERLSQIPCPRERLAMSDSSKLSGTGDPLAAAQEYEFTMAK